MANNSCKNGCNHKYHAKGYCRRCYDRLYRLSLRGIAVKVKRNKKLRLYGENRSEASKANRKAKRYELKYSRSERGKTTKAKYYLKLKERFKTSEEYRERARASRRVNMKNWLKNIRHRLHNNISSQINICLRNGKSGKSWPALVSYTASELKKHLESLFTEGMNWENYGEWHIDHKIPKAKFNFKSYKDIDFKLCWALSNLQPMWARDNFRKSDKVDKPFQPSLAIERLSNEN